MIGDRWHVRARRLGYAGARAVALLATAGLAAAAPAPADEPADAAPSEPDLPPLRLELDLSDHRLHVWQGDERVRTYTVSTGIRGHATPTGAFGVSLIIWNPPWWPPERSWAADRGPMPPGAPDNPMKVVKMLFRDPYYYIHGTDEVETLGESASHGCVRMAPADAADLAILLMRHDGDPRPPGWVDRVTEDGEPLEIRLDRAVPFEIRP